MSHHEVYGDDGGAERESCPRCGDSFLADHGDRAHCGKCSYTEWE